MMPPGLVTRTISASIARQSGTCSRTLAEKHTSTAPEGERQAERAAHDAAPFRRAAGGQFPAVGVGAEGPRASGPERPHEEPRPAADVEHEPAAEAGVLGQLADGVGRQDGVIAGRVRLLGAECPQQPRGPGQVRTECRIGAGTGSPHSGAPTSSTATRTCCIIAFGSRAVYGEAKLVNQPSACLVWSSLSPLWIMADRCRRSTSEGEPMTPHPKPSRRAFLSGAAAAGALAWVPAFRVTPASAQATSAAPPGFPSSISLYQQAYPNWAGMISIDNVWTAAPASPADVVTLANWAQAQRVPAAGQGHESRLVADPAARREHRGRLCAARHHPASDLDRHRRGLAGHGHRAGGRHHGQPDHGAGRRGIRPVRHAGPR